MEDEWTHIPQLPDSNCEEEFVDVGRGVKLRVLKWIPANYSSEIVNHLIMIPGWGSVFEGWRPLLSEWVTRRPIIYIETREKKSAIIEKKITKKDFQMEEHSKDLIGIINHLGLEIGGGTISPPSNPSIINGPIRMTIVGDLNDGKIFDDSYIYEKKIFVLTNQLHNINTNSFPYKSS